MDYKLILVLLLLLYLFGNATEGFSGAPICPNCRKATPFCGCKGGQWHMFKKPNYYGLGTWGYHYGEPFYWRHKNA